MENDKRNLAEIIKKIFTLHPMDVTFVDIGASGDPPEIWKQLSSYANYIGFDPDKRAIYEDRSGGFRRNVIINKAVTPSESLKEVNFFLTNSPYCSSTLQPDIKSLENYHYTDLFRVEDQKTVSASNFDNILDDIDVERADWIKTDSQGIDLQIYQSISLIRRNQILAIDIEPGLLDAYQNEDLFPESHTYFKSEGFWLSDVVVKGPVRLNQKSLNKIQLENPDISVSDIGRSLNNCPGWIEARYLRTISHLKSYRAPSRDYILLWVFSILDNQFGYCMDIALNYEDLFGKSDLSHYLWDIPKQILLNRLTEINEKEIIKKPVYKRIKTKIYNWITRK